MTFPARLHILLASGAPVGVVLRRGPARSVCSILWDRRTDQFQLGQWLRGRIYELRSDISPDGRHMIYFAMNGRWSSETHGSWTAISRTPWLKAVVLHGKGDCWQGGGLFTSRSRYWLNGCGHFTIRNTAELEQDTAFQPSGWYGAECPGIYYVKLQRDGWVLKDRLSAGSGDRFTVFEKPLGHGWILRKYAHAESGADPGRACYWDEHELEHPLRQQRMVFPRWEWADMDGKTLVWTAAGCLYRARLHAKELGAPKMLYDFNGMKFERREAPY
ncbi:MAG: hypothetical protein LAQ69_29900 [Acidobacteriia bacterium]|nr:hypothetical protein [Terriglobia bacterium]